VTSLGPAPGCCRERPRAFRRLDPGAVGELLSGVAMAVPDGTPALAGRFEVQVRPHPPAVGLDRLEPAAVAS
jgi:hypothetical protein